MNRIVVIAAVAATFAAAPAASAQPAYVGASLLADIVRVTESRTDRDDSRSGGEAIGFALRVGTHITDRWGVELEFARPSEIENEYAPDVIPYLAGSGAVTLTELVFADLSGVTRPFVPSFRINTTQRHTTLSATAFVRQDLSARAALVYLGGLGFNRSERTFSIAYDRPRAFSPTVVILPPTTTETVSYGVRPLAGMEARIGLTDQLELVPGIRLHGIDDGWLIRPAVGLNWKF